jgi:predicted acyl esterase
MKRIAILGLAVALAVPAGSFAVVGEPVCVETPRPDPSSPVLGLQRELLGFHDEELVICSPGFESPTHIAARLWVPSKCRPMGGCPGVLITHGFATTKEVTFSDMRNLALRGMYVLSYDVRGQGMSGGQAGLMGREEIADQAAVLAWFHEHVRPRKVGAYGISQGGSHAFMAAIFNCGSARAAAFDSTVPCDEGKRWVDAIAPVQGPTNLDPDGTCPLFGVNASVESRGNPEITAETLRCTVGSAGLDGPLAPVLDALPRFDREVHDYVKRAGRIDVPAYLATGFFDRLVLPQQTTDVYEILRARASDPLNPYTADVRLLITNDSHGTIGGNFAALDDIFAWLDWQLTGSPGPVRDARVAITQEWDDEAFRLEEDWPIPGTTGRTLFFSRAGGEGALVDAAPGDQSPDRLFNIPVVSSPPEVPFANGLAPVALPGDTPGASIAFLTEPLAETIEVAGLPEVALWISSANASGEGVGQVHVALGEVAPDGSSVEFARNRRGLAGLGPAPREVVLPLTVSSHRIDAGNRLRVTITPSDVTVVMPFVSADPFFVHHGGTYPSRLVVPLAPIDRPPVSGPVPFGPAFPGDALATLCQALGLPCPE